MPSCVRMATTLPAALLVAVAVVLTGCAAGPSDRADPGTSADRRSGGGGQLRAVAAFYPLQWIAERITGDKVGSLTKPGGEPHDVELAPRDVEQVAGADLVVYVKGFQPAVDTAVQQQAGNRGYDVRPSADLTPGSTPKDGGQAGGERATDPHFWLDPLRLAAVANGLVDRFASLDPGQAQRYRSNATALQSELRVLDRDYRTGLASCASEELVTSHNAFGYLARRYGLTQVGISGLSPDGEPKPADLTAIADYVRRKNVRTIYYETLVNPNIARTVGRETGAVTALLDPIEGLTSASPGRDYLEVMRSNLATLRKGQRCR